MDIEIALLNMRAAAKHIHEVDDDDGLTEDQKAQMVWAQTQTLAEFFTAADKWLSSGGYLPQDWQRGDS